MIKIMVILFMTNLIAKPIKLTEQHVICSFPKKELISFIKEGFYRPQSFDTEGFIHCCKPSQLSYVANKFFKEDEQILLISSKEILGADLKYEGDRDFPHLFRSFDREDLIDVIFLKRDVNTNQFNLEGL